MKSRSIYVNGFWYFLWRKIHPTFEYLVLFRHWDFYTYMMWLCVSPAQKRNRDFYWDRKHHSCFMWINVLFWMGWRRFSVQMRKEILHTFIAMDDRKAARKISHSIWDKKKEKGRQITLCVEDSFPRSDRMFACLQNKRKNVVKFLIFLSQIVLGVIYEPLLSRLPLKKKFRYHISKSDAIKMPFILRKSSYCF